MSKEMPDMRAHTHTHAHSRTDRYTSATNRGQHINYVYFLFDKIATKAGQKHKLRWHPTDIWPGQSDSATHTFLANQIIRVNKTII